MAQPDYYLDVSNVDTGSRELSKCDDQAKLTPHNDGSFKLIGSRDKRTGFIDVNDM